MTATPRLTSLSRNPGVWLLGLVMIALVAIVAFTYDGFRRAATDLVIDRDSQLTALSAARLQQSMADYAGRLTLLARSREMAEGGVAAQVAALRSAAARLSLFDGGVILIDGRGRVRAALPERPVLVARDWSNRDFFRAVLGGSEMALSDAQQLFPGDPFAVVIAVPIRGEGDSFLGALAGVFHLGEPTLSAFYGNIVRLRLGQTGTTYVVDGKGRILFDSESQRVGRFVGVDELSLLASRAISGAAVTQDETGNDVIASSAPVPGTTWTLIVEDDWSVLTGETSRYRDVLLVAFVAALLLPPLGLALASRQRRFRGLQITRPEQSSNWLKAVRDQLRPVHLPVVPGWQSYARQVDGRSLEHDFYDATLLPDGGLNIVLGKVSSSGIQAGVALASARAVLGSASQRLLPPADGLRECGALLASQHSMSVALRALQLRIDPTTGQAEYAAAGVNPPGSRGRTFVQHAPAEGEALGSATPVIQDGELRIGPGSLVVLLGPSMLEARNGDGQAFVHDALERTLADPYANLQELVDRILDDFRTFNEKSPFFAPDLTVIVLERSKAGS